MANDIDEIKKSVKDLSDIVSNFVKTVGQNQSALLAGDKGSGRGRYSTGLFGYSNMLTGSKNTEELLRMYEAAEKTNRQSSSFIGRVFKDLVHEKRNLEALKIDLDRNVGDFEKKTEELRNTIGSHTKNTSDLFKEASEKIKEYKEELEGLESKKSDALNNILKEKDEEKLRLLNEVAEKLKEAKEKGGLVDTTDYETKLGLSKEELTNYEQILEVNEKIVDVTNKENEAVSKGVDVLNQQINLREQSFRTFKDGLSQIGRGFKDIYNIGKQFADAWMKVDTASSNFARSIGMSGAGMAALRKNTIGRIANTNLSDLYGVGMEDLIKLQAGYNTSIGRAVGLSNADQENAIAMSVVMGERGGQLAASLENFGLSYSDAAKRAGKMFQDAGKYGLSFEKYSENFLQNIKIAQNYTFRNGLKGLESMAKKATAIKLDMQQVAAFADKVGTLQGSVETAAQLQVLGGPFAQFSDPLGMLNESMTNMEGLMDRFQNMVGNLGRFNMTTGQVEVSAFNKQRIRAAAQAMGMSYDQVMESVQAQGRRNYIEGKIGKGFSDEEREFIMNTASVKNGTPTLSYIDRSGNRVEKDVSKMSKQELQFAREQNQSQSDDIKSIAKDTRQMAQQVTGVQNKADAVRAKRFEGIHKAVSGGMSFLNKNVSLLVDSVAIIKGLLAVQTIGGGIGTSLAGMKGYQGVSGSGVLGRTTAGRSLNAGFHGHTTSGGGALARGANKYGMKWNSVAKNGMSGRAAFGKSVGLGMGVGIGAEVIGQGGKYLINKSNEDNIARGKYKEYSDEDIKHRKWASGLSAAGHGAALGATIGSFIPVPVVGTLVGAGIGALAGGIIGAVKEGKNIEKEKAQIDKGEFELQNGNITIVNGTFDRNVENIERANGGLLNGPSHKKGGMPILGSNITVEGGEFVVNKRSTAKNIGLLQKINDMGDGGIIKPRMLANGGMLTVTPTTSSTGESGGGKGGVRGSSKSDININFSGTIKLETPGGKNVDITDEMLKNPDFIRKITKLIEKQMTINEKGGNVVKKGLY